MEESNSRHEAFASRLQQTAEERSKKKDDREQSSILQEQTKNFFSQFESSLDDIRRRLGGSGEVKKSQLTEHFDSISVDLQKVQKLLTEATAYLTRYNIESSQRNLGALIMAIQERRSELLPKKKFAFKSKKQTAKDTTDSPPPTALKTPPMKKKIEVAMTDCRFTDEADKKLMKVAEEVKNKDVALSKLSNCDVFLHGSPSAIHISHLNDCRVFCGPVSGSIFIDDCSKCTFVLACQQLRIHNTFKTSFYIHVTSKAIIEDTKEVVFAPYNLHYERLNEDYKESGLEITRNNWSAVDDFNWLAMDSPSPNWSTIEPQDRVVDWDLSIFN